MGFGKKSKGKKDKKDKGRKGKQDEWTFEGGSKYVEKKETHDERGKLLHRNTQEKDEKERRGLLKMMDNNRKRAIEQKMANKVKFQDFLSKVEDGSDSEGETDAQRQKKQRKEIAAGQKSSLTVLQRLQKFSTGKSSTHKDTLISQFMTEDDSDSSEEEEAEDEEHANDNNNNVSDEDVEDMEEEDEESEKEEVEEEVEEELDSDEEGNEGAEDKSPYSWFFDSENTSNQTAAADTSSGSKNKNTLTTVEMEAQGGGKIDFSIVGPASGTLVPTPYNKIVATSDKEKQKGLNKAAPVALRSISNMIGHAPPKIFRSVEKLENSTTASASAFAAPVTQKLLPYLSTYADMMIEGRDYKNDNKILTATLTHVCTHIMKARSKVLRHNTKLKKKMLDSIAKRGGDKEKDKQHKQHSGKDKSWITDKNENGGDAVDVDAGDRQITNTTLSDHTQQVQEQEQEDEIEEENDAETDKGTNNTNYDQGFVRPRVLILCPYRGVALKIVDKIRTILGENTTVANLDKFHEEFGSVDYGDGDNSDTDSDSDSDNNDNNNGEGKKEKNKKKKKKGPPPRPADWNADFQQNVDDDFKLGIQINPGKGKGSGSKKGAYLRLFSDFYISDIILASPLGLRFILERASGSKDKDKDKKGGENGNDDGNDEGSDDENMQTEEKDEAASDFLSSLEVVMAHQADVMYMQNWDHVSFCLDRTNLMPKSNHDTDFSRVRPYFLDPGMSCTRRQMIMTSSFSEPSIQACFRTHARSIAGQLKMKRDYSAGAIGEVMRNLKQIFQKVPTVASTLSALNKGSNKGKKRRDEIPSFALAEEERFQYFKEQVLMPILRTGQGRTLIVAPSYVHYVRIRNELMRLEANAAYICEYSRDSEISRGRSRFFHGAHDILLYSGRCHYFRRFAIRGARHVVFYSLPEYPHLYPDLVNSLSASFDAGKQQQLKQREDNHAGGAGAAVEQAECSSLVLFSKYDKMALERVVGQSRSSHMLKSDKAAFLFQ